MKDRGGKQQLSGFDQMEENLRRDHGAGSRGRVLMRRYTVHGDGDGDGDGDDDDDAGDGDGDGDGDLMGECTGKHCKSCTAGLIADCVAICCCPCALFNFFTLAFVKFPWMVGRKCLGSRRQKKKKLALQESDRNCKKCGDGDVNNSNLMKNGRVELGSENMSGGDGVDSSRNSNVSARLEAERVWLELYQIGHLGFGRVSFTGIQ